MGSDGGAPSGPRALDVGVPFARDAPRAIRPTQPPHGLRHRPIEPRCPPDRAGQPNDPENNPSGEPGTALPYRHDQTPAPTRREHHLSPAPEKRRIRLIHRDWITIVAPSQNTLYRCCEQAS